MLWLLGLALIGATIAPILETNLGWVRILGFPRPQIAGLLAFAALASVMLLDRRSRGTWILLAGLLGALGLQLWWICPFTALVPVQVGSAIQCPETDRLSVISVNLRVDNRGADRFLDLVRQRRPDLVFVVEFDAGWRTALAPLEDIYPHRVLLPRADAWGMALYARLPLIEPEIRFLLEDYVPSVRTGLRLRSGAEVIFHGLHPKPPLPGDSSAERDAELVFVAREIARNGRPAVLAGDLNAVAWSHVTRRVQRLGGLLDPRIGRGIYPTFDARMPAFLRWPIDQILFTSEFRLGDLDVLPDVGSDHLPIAAALCHTPAPRAARLSPQAAHADNRSHVRKAVHEPREDRYGG